MSVRLVQKSIQSPSPLGAYPKDGAERTSRVLERLKTRGHERYGFLDAGAEILPDVVKLAEKLRAASDDLIVLGIGGSALGTTAFMHACNAEKRAHVHVLESPDPVHLRTVLDKLDPKRTAVNVVSKSGTTLETLSQWSVIKAWMEKANAFDQARVVMTTDPKSGPLRAYADAGGYATLPVPELIGGRYSVFTPVGLLPLAYAGADLNGIAAGVKDAAQNGLGKDGVASVLAQALSFAQLGEGRPLVVVWPYGERLQAIGRWFQQLWAESLGKAVHKDGRPAHVGSTPLACVGPNDQHSLLQLFGDGPRDKHYLFLCAETVTEKMQVQETIGGAEFLRGKDLQEILIAEARATTAAIASSGQPCSFLWLKDMSAKTMARLFVDLMSATVIASELYDVDPFDQPAVELGKRIALGLLGMEKHQAEATEMAAYLP